MSNAVYWAVLMEKAMAESAVSALLNVAIRAGGMGAIRIILPTMRTDVTRNMLVRAFLEQSKNRNDTLVMLDADHNHPQNVVDALAAHTEGVVGALCHRRWPPYDPCAFFRGGDGNFHSWSKWSDDMLPCTFVGTGAIAVKRWVFEALAKKTNPTRFFIYDYPDGERTTYPTEDVHFGLLCEDAGIPHWCDTRIKSPHITVAEIDTESWETWKQDHPGKEVDSALLGTSKPVDLKDALGRLGEAGGRTVAELLKQKADREKQSGKPAETGKLRMARIITRIQG